MVHLPIPYYACIISQRTVLQLKVVAILKKWECPHPNASSQTQYQRYLQGQSTICMVLAAAAAAQLSLVVDRYSRNDSKIGKLYLAIAI